MRITHCLYPACGRYLPIGKFRDYESHCSEECFEKHTDQRSLLYDLKFEYWKETHPQPMHNFSDRRKIGGWHPGIEEGD